MSRRIRVAVDAMGGDFAPEQTVAGAVAAARAGGIEILLVGHLDKVSAALDKHDITGLPIHCFHAEEHIPDGGNVLAAIREKKSASVLVANRLVKEGWADAVVSLGHTGAAILASSIVLGRMPGVDRPACGACLPIAPKQFILDLGVTANCTGEHLFQLAIMGKVYVESVMGIVNPKVAVLSNGSEEGKGNLITRRAYQLLKDSDLNFIGNVEGLDLVTGKANVVVCDGFVGNVFLKFGEALSQRILECLERALGEHWSMVAANPWIRQLQNMVDITRADGVGIALGINGVSVLGHGRSKAADFQRAIERAAMFVEQRVVEKVRVALAESFSETKEAMLLSGT